MKIFKILLLVFVFSAGIVQAQKASEKINVILDTDIGNDVDDALAIDMVFKYVELGKVNFLAMSNVKNCVFAVHYLDLFNRWYGYKKLPLYTIKPIVLEQTKKKRFTQITVELEEEGKRVFAHKKTDRDVMEAVDGLRKTLSKQADGSVTFISLGYLTNLSKLLDSRPDKYSPLTGVDLVKRKVRLLSMMGGDFRGVERTEFNIRYDVASAQNVFKNWPSPIVTSPFEVGMVIKYPAKIIETKFDYVKHHPLVVSYKNYLKMPYDRETWDLTSVLYAVEGEKFFNISKKGEIEVIGKGKTIFSENSNGNRQYLMVTEEQQKMVLDRLVELTTLKPKKHKK